MSSAHPTTQRDSAATALPAEAWNRSFLRIGHGGAAAHARANSLRSLAQALEMGVDMVEFDVRPCRDALVLLHDDSLARFGAVGLASASSLAELGKLPTARGEPIATLAEALDLLRGRALINVDLKATGYEDAVVEQVRCRGMGGDALYSSVYPASLRRVREVEPEARTGLSYPQDRANASGKPHLKPVVNVAVALMRLALPYRVLRMMASARSDAVMLYHGVVSAAVVRTVQRSGGKVFVWTVDTAQRLRQIRALGVNGIASNHPELFARALLRQNLTGLEDL